MGHRFGPIRHARPDRWGGGPEIFQVIMWAAIVAVLVALAVWLIMNIRRGAMAPAAMPALTAAPPAVPRVDAALTEARLRYARGEMAREDYLQIVADLGGTHEAGS